jgi:hypothetical protein
MLYFQCNYVNELKTTWVIRKSYNCFKIITLYRRTKQHIAESPNRCSRARRFKITIVRVESNFSKKTFSCITFKLNGVLSSKVESILTSICCRTFEKIDQTQDLPAFIIIWWQKKRVFYMLMHRPRWARNKLKQNFFPKNNMKARW